MFGYMFDRLYFIIAAAGFSIGIHKYIKKFLAKTKNFLESY
jgi:hypothetical protein